MEHPTGLNLRDYQIKAVNKATEAIMNGSRTALLAMATGTGKTRTVLGLIYKMLESKRFNRILFLVDRLPLGEQAMDTFKDVKLKDLMTLNEIYELKAIDDNEINPETKVSVSTVQGLLRRTILAETPDLMPGAFDLIIVDEAHRGYILDREMTQEEILYDNQEDYMSKYKQSGHFYSEKEDTLKETTRGYGDTERPEDYLEAFAKYVNENKDKIEAIRVACTKPSEMTRAQLRELKLVLDKENFTETSLNEATSAVTNAHIVADIIAHVRKVVLKTPLISHDERVEGAFAKLTATHRFNKIQLDLLEKIKTYMLHESILNTETFEAPVFKTEGGFARFNKKFGGTLIELIREINTYIYEGAA